MQRMQQPELEWAEASITTAEPRDAAERRALLEGDVVFASAEEQTQRCTELLGAGALLVTLPPPGPEVRGRLGDLLEELVERELARMGAPSPYLAAWCAMPEDAQARLADQLFRARTVGATGLVIAMGSLAAIAQPELTTDDSATLRWLAETTNEASLVLMLDDADLGRLGYAAPLPLGVLLGGRRRATAFLESVVEIETIDDTCVAETAGPETEETVHAEAEPLPTPVDDIPIEVVVAPEEPAPVARVAKVANERARASIGVPQSGPNDAWRGWALALSATRGAQPLAMFERMFIENYVPLTNAIAAGLDDPRAIKAHDDFKRSFERSYADAFATFGATTRRPRLVMDAYDIASKQARLANARLSHVLVVDSMRFDLGCLVRDALARETPGVATLVAETLLWSALPTTTSRQIETMARGLDALREPSREEPSESLRGRAAEVVRRTRLGSRELYKLDLVASMLEASNEGPPPFETIAQHTAEALARHISTLPPRTLLLVVGDHGFTLDRRGNLTSGGASPEEVLVSAMAWLVGELH